MHQFSSFRTGVAGSVQRLGLILVCAVLLAVFATPVLAQDAYPGPATDVDPGPTVVIESYPGADTPVPAQNSAPANPTAYPEPNQPTTGPAVPNAESGNAGQSAVATPVPMPSVPVDSGSQVSLLLVGLVLLGLLVVVGLILARRRK